MNQTKSKGYMSGIDQFLVNFDQSHPTLSQTQKREKAKHDQVYELRDKPKPSNRLNTSFEILDF